MIDKLIKRIRELKNPSVVGLDPTIDNIPKEFISHFLTGKKDRAKALSQAFLCFNKLIIDAVKDLVPAVKPQIAMYEALGIEGIKTYIKTCDYAKSKNLIVIGDIKRGDISSTASAYAAHLFGIKINGQKINDWNEDFITVNPYLGSDGIYPFVDACKKEGKGIFILVKTSNKSSNEIQDLVVGGETIYKKVAKLVTVWGKELVGKSKFSSVGAVVGATNKKVGEELRKKFPSLFFLVPGYGAQGAGVSDIKGFFNKEGEGAIINSSRAIISAWKKENLKGKSLIEIKKIIKVSAREATLRMRDEIREEVL